MLFSYSIACLNETFCYTAYKEISQMYLPCKLVCRLEERKFFYHMVVLSARFKPFSLFVLMNRTH